MQAISLKMACFISTRVGNQTYAQVESMHAVVQDSDAANQSYGMRLISIILPLISPYSYFLFTF